MHLKLTQPVIFDGFIKQNKARFGIDAFKSTCATGVKYTAVLKTQTGMVHMLDLSLVQNGKEVLVKAFNHVKSGDSLAYFTAQIIDGSCGLMIETAHPNTSIQLVRSEQRICQKHFDEIKDAGW